MIVHVATANSFAGPGKIPATIVSAGRTTVSSSPSPVGLKIALWFSGEVVMRLLGLLATIPALMLTGCAARVVSSHVELGADFANYRSYTDRKIPILICDPA